MTDLHPPELGEEPSAEPALRRLAAAVRSYPIPIVALAGLGVGLFLAYLTRQVDLANLVWFATLLLGGLPLVLATVRRIARREFASDIIASVAIVGAIGLDQPFAGAIIVLMQSGGEAIEAYAHRRATSSLDRLTQRAPRWAHRYEGGKLARVPAEAVRPGDRLAVRSGDILPVDGTIASADALIDEATLTGEPLPKLRHAGEPIASGSVNVGPAFDLVALRSSGESQYAKIVELVRTAQASKPSIQRLADRYATWFTPTVLVVAVLAAVLNRNPVTGLAVLVVATPCPLILATPIAVLRAIDRAAARGIIAKSGAAMEELGRARAVLFDKTGTLTLGRPEVERIVAFAEESEAELLRLLAAIEQFSSHPLAEAVGRRALGLPLPEVANHHEFPGSGVAGTIAGRRLVAGSRGFCETIAHANLARAASMVRETGPEEGRLVAYLLLEGRPIGAVLFVDPVRPEVEGLAERLRGLGIREIGLLTGDTRPNAEEIARIAGITRVEAELLPQEKVERVGEFRRRYGSTVMVGDGINDAAALATASVGVAMGARGAGISTEAADAVLVVDDVGRVADGIALGQRMLRIAQQGILVGLGASLVLMGIASFGYIAPADGAVLQEVLDVAVIGNALRVR